METVVQEEVEEEEEEGEDQDVEEVHDEQGQVQGLPRLRRQLQQ